ncbi:DUF1793-domain-containing protein [Fistulina hepatica ATCC 64428]|nr:DUF1793-domain-containing protein [Fistulina hepatica ATCC 64428]
MLYTLILAWSPGFTGAVSYSPLLPPSYPLAVRNPYLSAWLPGNLAANLSFSSAQFWYGNDLGWSILARVNNQTYNVFGVPSPANETRSASLLSATYTSTHTVFTVAADTVNLTIDFFSPVDFSDYVRQSLPFSYLTISVAANGSTPSVQLYTDIDDTWTGQSSATTWSYTVSGNTSVYRLSADGGVTYAQNANEMALWGEAVHAIRNVEGVSLSVGSGPSATIRQQFITDGFLPGDLLSWTSGGVVAFACDIGSVIDDAAVTFAIGYVREAAVNYLGDPQTGYYRIEYPDTMDAVVHFLDDYIVAASIADAIDTSIREAATYHISSNYSDILELSLRQILGGMDVTVPNATLNTSDVMAFIKEISSDGNVNTVDLNCPTFPVFYIWGPEYIRLLMEPVLRYLESGRYAEKYVIHDIGSSYPNATGHDNLQVEEMPIEETGNLMILALAYQLATGDTEWVSNRSAMFQGYADYLVDNGLYPAYQYSTNDALGEMANQTNLGIKAAVGLTAYGNLTGQSNYTDVGRSFANTIYNDRLGTNENQTFFTIQYGSPSWFLVFNLYPDLLFGLDTFPYSAFVMEKVFYPSARDEAGVAIDGDVLWGKTDWQMWAAAAADVNGTTTRDMFIDDLHAYIANGLNMAPFSDRYWVADSGTDSAGTYYDFRARPSLGGHFAPLALTLGPNGL